MKKMTKLLRVCALTIVIALGSSYCVYAEDDDTNTPPPTTNGYRCDLPEGEQTY